MIDVFTLLVLFQLKHFICDYPLQNQYMLGKLLPSDENWELPLLAHVLVHGLATFLIAIYFTSFEVAIFVSLIDIMTHFVIDRIKASPDLLGRFKPTQPYFWWALGADQMLHHLVHYFLIAIILGLI